ncbi:hypothetical protein [Leptospira meyeri]|uniref:hypothetical protein n=1 Tax=Leptospira meyeri TaxID=29508 RepID=UPI000F6503C7|nr:hypothetical protein [Leptospira meyeri]
MIPIFEKIIDFNIEDSNKLFLLIEESIGSVFITNGFYGKYEEDKLVSSISCKSKKSSYEFEWIFKRSTDGRVYHTEIRKKKKGSIPNSIKEEITNYLAHIFAEIISLKAKKYVFSKNIEYIGFPISGTYKINNDLIFYSPFEDDYFPQMGSVDRVFNVDFTIKAYNESHSHIESSRMFKIIQDYFSLITNYQVHTFRQGHAWTYNDKMGNIRINLGYRNQNDSSIRNKNAITNRELKSIFSQYYTREFPSEYRKIFKSIEKNTQIQNALSLHSLSKTLENYSRSASISYLVACVESLSEISNKPGNSFKNFLLKHSIRENLSDDSIKNIYKIRSALIHSGNSLLDQTPLNSLFSIDPIFIESIHKSMNIRSVLRNAILNYLIREQSNVV